MAQEIDNAGFWDLPGDNILIIGRRGVGKTWLSRKLVRLWLSKQAPSLKSNIVVRLGPSDSKPETPDEVPNGLDTLRGLASASLKSEASEVVPTLASMGLLVPENRVVVDREEAGRVMRTFDERTHSLCVVEENPFRERECILSGYPSSSTYIRTTQYSSDVQAICRRHFRWVLCKSEQDIGGWNEPFEFQGLVRDGDRHWVLFRRTQVELAVNSHLAFDRSGG
jgi:hypothetical protein